VDEKKKKNAERRATNSSKIARYRMKAKKYQQKESKEYTYKVKDEKGGQVKKEGIVKKESRNNKNKDKPRSCVCLGCGKVVTE
jgi:hypothetical protein